MADLLPRGAALPGPGAGVRGGLRADVPRAAREFFAARQAKGDYPGIRPERLARLFCDTVLSGLLNRLLLDGALPGRAERARHVAAIAQVFARGALP
ncbi:MAG: hypothetical protein IPO20_12485 [Gammaproteobacteria bacterium]|nr:hypothetical protein [Gammaproteobacteria bacterium]